MKRRPDTADEILRISGELRKRYRVRNTDKGPVMQPTAPAPARGVVRDRKSVVRMLRRLEEHNAELKWFHRLVVVQRQYYLGMHRLEPTIALMCAIFRAAHEARYPSWRVNGPPPRKQDQRKEARWTGEEARAQGIIEDLWYPPRGTAGRAKAHKEAMTTKRSATRKAQALALLARGGTQAAVAKKLRLAERTVRRYQKGK